MTQEKLKYPIGKYEKQGTITREIMTLLINDISSFPLRLTMEVIHLSDKQLNTPYRSGGWTIRQVVHHCADSHMNALRRLKLTLTENKPIVKPYKEERWA